MIKLVAVYGTLRKKEHNHRLLEDSEFIGNGTVNGFKMYHLGGFPALQHDEGVAVVEVYRVDRDTMISLDRLEGYRGDDNNFYDREVTEVLLDSGETERAWVYFIDSNMQHRGVVKSGDWVKDK